MAIDLTRWTENNTNGTNTQTGGDLVQAAQAIGGIARLENNMPDILVDDSWFFLAQYVSLGIPTTSDTIEQFLEINAGGSLYTIGYRRESGGNQQVFTSSPGGSTQTDISSLSDGVSIQRGDYGMSDNFGGDNQNSAATDDNRYSQRWVFEPFDGPVFEYEDLAEQTPATVVQYDSVAQIVVDTVFQYDSRGQIIVDTVFQYDDVSQIVVDEVFRYTEETQT